MKIYAVMVPGGKSTQGSFANWAEAHMRLYCAWTGSMPQFPSLVAAAPPMRILISRAYDNRLEAPLRDKIAEHHPLAEIDLMVDSGAFSAWTIGKPVDLGLYIDWVKEQQPHFGNMEVLNLDVIPGSPGNPGSDKDRKRAIAQSMENADAIRDAGLPVMEVFHLYDEDFGVFEKLWERRRPGELLAIGGIAGLGTSMSAKQVFGDDVFRRVKDWCGGWDKTVPLHGLGVSPDSALARRYPWWSTDSSSWTIFQRYGREIKKNGLAQKSARLAPGGAGRDDASRTSVRAVSDLMYIRVVRRWRRLEDEYTRMWYERGVRFIEREAIPV